MVLFRRLIISPGIRAAFRPRRLFSDNRPKAGHPTELVLFDRKPRWWARWAYWLLLVDAVVTVHGLDITFNYWTEKVKKEPAPSISTTTPSTTPSNDADEYEWVLRPAWQRVNLCLIQVLFGVGLGAAILASRESTVWRMRILRSASPRLLQATPRPKSLPSSRPPPKGKSQPLSPYAGPPPSTSTSIPILELSTGSGRVKSYLLQNCTLQSGRDHSELILRILGIKGHFWVGLIGSRVLGVEESPEEMPVIETRRRLVERWQEEGGHVLDYLREKGGAGWVGGPVVR